MTHSRFYRSTLDLGFVLVQTLRHSNLSLDGTDSDLIGQNFAYNEASFVMVRIMQAFEGFELRQAEDAPKGSNPPEFWQERKGRNKVEKIWPVAAITMFSKVCPFFSVCCCTGRTDGRM